MSNIPQRLSQEFSLKLTHVHSALELFAEGATVPFIARYRKERTGEMNEVQLRDLQERHLYLTELAERKQVILSAIAQQGKLTPELESKIANCLQKTELEDLYLPYRPKRRTRATIAREKGLEPLAVLIKSWNTRQSPKVDLAEAAQPYLSVDREVETPAAVLQGAADILAEEIAEKAHLRTDLRQTLLTSGQLRSKIKADFPEGTTKFEMYRDYQASVAAIAAHNLLALYRGEDEGILIVELEFDQASVLADLEAQEIHTRYQPLRDFYRRMLQDAFGRLMKNSLITEVRALKKQSADTESIQTFASNLRQLLLASPAGMKPTLALDPGFRTGCKAVVLDQTGKFLHYQTLFPHQGVRQRQEATRFVIELIAKYQIELIAIGNGTAGRETDEFVAEAIATLPHPPIKVMVNESGASIYSASPIAIAEFPDQDVTVRGAISIGRRLQDPLAELVKIDPKSIGVGQYQHDVDQKLLKKKLDETVESCVNYVGVDLNTASSALLTFVSGITPAIANNIVEYRNQQGAFRDRRQLLKVPKLGPKAFEQAAGFLRIRAGDNPLDNTAVHPESYDVVAAIAADLQLPLNQITHIAQRLKSVDLKRYVTETIGEPTLRDILGELEKPGRDPRAEFTTATFKPGITEIQHLEVGMELEGIVTNVANFGAFVDIGVHQDGLVHVSQLADQFVRDPQQIVKVGQVVKVRVLEVNVPLKRISLSMRSAEKSLRPASQSQVNKSQVSKLQITKPQATKSQTNPPPTQRSAPDTKPATLEDLQAKFGKKFGNKK
jgi:protein Tex